MYSHDSYNFSSPLCVWPPMVELVTRWWKTDQLENPELLYVYHKELATQVLKKLIVGVAYLLVAPPLYSA